MPSDDPVAARLRLPAIALLGGLLVAFSMPPWGFWPLSFLGIAAFALTLHELDGRRRAWCGFAFGLGWMFPAMGWMWFLTVPGYLIAGVFFAALHAVAAIVAPTGPWRTIARPAAHTITEIVRMSFPFGGVPLATLGIAQAGGPLLGVARVGGVILLTWIVFQVGFAVAEPVRWAIAGEPIAAGHRHGVVAVAAAAAVVALSAVAPSGRTIDTEPLTIAAVQGGGEQGTSALDVESIVVTERHLAATASIAPSDELDLVVWPENGIDVNRQPFAGSEQYEAVAAEAARLGVPLSVGVTVDAEYSAYPSDDGFVNAQVIVTPEGRVTSSYEKVRIVPFGEYVPMRGLLEALGAPLDRVAADANPGRDPARIAMPDGTELGVMISWEVFFGGRGRAAADAEILLNPTNGASYTGTILQTQQIASSKLRAIETGRWIVQVSPTGFSAFVSSDGEVFQRTDVSERAVITMDVPLRDGSTWYRTVGDRPWIALVVAVFGFAVWRSGWRPGWRFGQLGSNQSSTSPPE